ncbi:MAG: aminoacyl-tRNA hydrolase [Deltaproteobacteria bacterium]|jgi:PTH1 family peptidyl-tRNA hydrolase|nr:aminoacyl-tRNA hydrolase [Deltaproteobacteria bacterium]MBW2571445.1 aminoacyl-tRNA hydrolase [Deltaproteobacteria bacterium]MBW2668624.1 aminoacyl-tRNA hydrolase [Deltaproteobacteria bacterium]
MPQKRLRLVVGLGNPGETYSKTRHNAGFMVVDKVSDAFSIALQKRKFDARFGIGSIDGIKVILAKPMAFMNRSGPYVQKIAGYFRILCEDMLVIHDDIDLAFGRLKIKEKGGDGGHRGIRSIIDAFGGGDFMRLRIGVGRPEAGIGASDYVLGKFTLKEKKVLNQIITTARDAVVTILCKGTKEGMNRFNNRRIVI